MPHVAIVGSGFVGATTAYALLHRGVARRLSLVDVDRERAEGEAMDLVHALPFLKNATVQASSLEDLEAPDLVIISAGRNSVPGETRMDLLKDNVGRVRSICRTARSWTPAPLVLVVSNPVDVLAQAAWEELGRPSGRVFGSGTTLDTARLKTLLGSEFGLDPHSIHGYILGEHGDSEFAAWSTVAAGGLGIRQWPGYDAARAGELFEKARRAAYEIIRRKRATYYAIGAACSLIAEAVLRDQRTILPVSVPSEGRYGTAQVFLSLPCVLGRGGVERVVEPHLEDAEVQALRRSADAIARAFSSIP